MTVVIGKINNELIVNPSIEQIEKSTFELIITASNEKIIMLELAAGEITEAEFAKAVEFARLQIQEINNFFQQIFTSLNIQKTPLPTVKSLIDKELEGKIIEELKKALTNDD